MLPSPSKTGSRYRHWRPGTAYSGRPSLPTEMGIRTSKPRLASRCNASFSDPFPVRPVRLASTLALNDGHVMR